MVTNIVFQHCVDFLYWLAANLFMTYEEVNVWLFVVLWPAITFGLMVMVIRQWGQIRKLKGRKGSKDA